MLQNIFANFEHTKLLVDHPETTNAIFLIIIVFVSVVTSRKVETTFLDRDQTSQLRGLAILLVILGHFWVHVAQIKTSFTLGGEAVALFFMLSGYGLSASSLRYTPNPRNFFFKRIKRVMVPYWMATILILALDYVILQRVYSTHDLTLSFFGLNINSSTRRIDYVRWYITLLLVWYFIFYTGFAIIKSNNRRICVMFMCGVAIFLADYYITGFGWYQIFAFPTGCLIGIHYRRIANFLENKNRAYLYLAVILLSFFSYKLYLVNSIEPMLPSIVSLFISEIMGIVFGVGMIFGVGIIGKMRRISRFILFTGSVSYELFLLHGAFLIKYDLFISSGSLFLLLVQFMAFLIFIMILSMIFKILLSKFSTQRVSCS